MKEFYIASGVLLLSIVGLLVYIWHNSPIEGLY